MSPAGAGVRQFRTRTNKPIAYSLLAVVALTVCVFAFNGSSSTPVAHAAPVAAYTPAWNEFQADCVAGPAPGQGSTPQACLCWETNLQAVAILPAYAVDALNAAQVGGGAAYTVPQNLGNLAISNAMQGCGLYTQQP